LPDDPEIRVEDGKALAMMRLLPEDDRELAGRRLARQHADLFSREFLAKRVRRDLAQRRFRHRRPM
jgi:hypothetical protein